MNENTIVTFYDYYREIADQLENYISEGSVSHINSVWSSCLDFTASFVENKQNMSHMRVMCDLAYA